MTDFLQGESDQHLTAGDLETRTFTTTDDPPEFVLVMDVTHDETQLAWRQEVALSKHKAVELTQLMDYSLTQVGVDWRPSEASDHTPAD